MNGTVAAPMIDDVRQGVAFLRTQLARSVTLHGRSMIAIAETAQPFNNSRWFWTDDNAKALELLSLPPVWDKDPEFSRAILDFLLAMSPETMIWRRAAEPMLQLQSSNPKAFVVLTPFQAFSGDLSRGILRQSSRFNDGRGGITAQHTGNLVELRHGGRRHCVDVEDAIVDYGIIRTPACVTLFHESAIRVSDGIMRRRSKLVATLRYDYAISAHDARLGLRVTLRAEPGVRLSDIRITTAVDGLNDRRRVLAVGQGGEQRVIRTHKAGIDPFHQGRLDYLSLHETGLPGFAPALHIRPRQPERLLKLVGTWTAEDRLNWLVARYQMDRLVGGEAFTIEEDRLVTCGGGLASAPAVAALLSAPETLQGIDPSISYDTGAELNAIATAYLHGAAGRYAVPIGDAELARWRAWFDRHLTIYFGSMTPADATGTPAIFVRGLAFTILALDSMLRATGDQAYALSLAAAIDLLLPAQDGGTDEGVFRDTGSPQSYLDCHAAGILALARVARPGGDSRIVPALQRALGALRFGTVMVSHGDTIVPFDTIVVRSAAPGGQWQEDGGFWSYKMGLLLRALQAAIGVAANGVLPLTGLELRRLETMARVCRQQIQGVRRERPEGAEFLTSTIAGETNSETQPWVLLGLIAPDRSLPDLRVRS